MGGFIDANTHGLIKKLVKDMQNAELLPDEKINWDNIGDD